MAVLEVEVYCLGDLRGWVDFHVVEAHPVQKRVIEVTAEIARRWTGCRRIGGVRDIIDSAVVLWLGRGISNK